MVITSLSPNHSNKEQQHKAIKSWLDLGRCFSMNRQSEIDALAANQFIGTGISFIPTERTTEHFVGKYLVSINAMIDIARSHGKDLLITNSDILIYDLPELKSDGVTVFSRYDYTDSMDESKMFFHGYDVFHIPKQFLKIFPPSIYGMGMPWWDYWIPFHCIKNNIPVYYPGGRYAFHKLHSTQYSMEEWYYIGEYFKWEFKIDKRLTIEQVASTSLTKIKNYLTR